MAHIKYRPDIDGLRAVAVICVVGFHAFPDFIQGGFIGVDIFFVISGFLISSIIYSGLDNATFSYVDFYLRRIKRIFPVLILVLFISLLLGWYILFSDEFQQLGKHVVGGLGFISNFVYWNESGYFDNSSETKPLLHLWSLGVEEQFYIIWPLLLVFLYRVRTNLLVVLLFVIIFSFLLNLYVLHAFSSVSAFYFPLTRFWELFLGGLGAYISIYKDGWLLKRKLYLNIQSIFGVLLILFSVIYINKHNNFPGWWAVLPTFGALLIISSPKSWLGCRFFSQKLMVYIGLISYPLYLWHWVLLSFLYILGYTDQSSKLTAVFISVVLAVISYEYIEKLFRGKYSSLSNFILLSFFIGLTLFALVVYMGKISPRNDSQRIDFTLEATHDWAWSKGMKAEMIDGIEVYVKKGNDKTVLFYGDSHMQQYAPRITKLINDDLVDSKTAVFATRGGCLPILGVYGDRQPDCNKDFKDIITKYALSPEVDSVVIGAYWSGLSPSNNNYYYLVNGGKKYFNEGGVSDAYRELESFLLSISKYKKVYFVLDNPYGKWFDPRALLIEYRITDVARSEKVYFQEYEEKDKQLRSWLMGMKGNENIVVIDPVEHFCNNGKCKTILPDGTPIYKDTNHICYSYAWQFIDYLDITIKE